MANPAPVFTSTVPDKVVPYLTRDQYRAAPTSVDTSNLINGGTSADQDAELDRILRQASAWCDNYAQQPLTAQQTTEQLRSRVTRNGQLLLHPRQWPVVGVTGVGYGSDPSALTYLTDLSHVWIEPQSVVIPLAAALNAGWSGALQWGTPQPGARVLTQLSYIAGYPVMVATAASLAGATTLTVRDSTGVLVGQELRVASGGGPGLAQQVVSVAAVSGSTVTLTTGLAVPVPVGASVTSLPEEVEQAGVYAATAIIKQRGAGSLVMRAGQAGTVGKGEGGVPGAYEFEVAASILDHYRAVSP